MTDGAPGLPAEDALVARLRAAGCVFAEEEAALLVAEAGERHPGPRADAGSARAEALEAMTRARISGEPLETVVGWAEFAGRRIVVRPRVFVPRRRTERLASSAVAAARAARPGAVVVDLCCGSGAIGAVVLDEVPGVELHAGDIDPDAVACAEENLRARGGAVHHGDLLDALPEDLRGRVDVLVANVPYVPRAGLASMPPEARLHEPVATRDGGEDGLDVLRRVVAGCGPWLAPGGGVMVEVAEAQVAAALDAVRAAGLAASTSGGGAAADADADSDEDEDDDDDDEDDGTVVILGHRIG